MQANGIVPILCEEKQKWETPGIQSTWQSNHIGDIEGRRFISPYHAPPLSLFPLCNQYPYKNNKELRY
jgi:hypothetical protein